MKYGLILAIIMNLSLQSFGQVTISGDSLSLNGQFVGIHAVEPQKHRTEGLYQLHTVYALRPLKRSQHKAIVDFVVTLPTYKPLGFKWQKDSVNIVETILESNKLEFAGKHLLKSGNYRLYGLFSVIGGTILTLVPTALYPIIESSAYVVWPIAPEVFLVVAGASIILAIAFEVSSMVELRRAGKILMKTYPSELK